jgi:hypothetical protein
MLMKYQPSIACGLKPSASDGFPEPRAWVCQDFFCCFLVYKYYFPSQLPDLSFSTTFFQQIGRAED